MGMEELCRQRHAMGLNATAMEFPEVEGVGMAAKDRDTSFDTASIHCDQVLRVFKHVLGGTAPIGPLIGILTFGFMLPRPPISFIQHAPLYARRNLTLWNRLKALEGKIGSKKVRQLRAAMKDVQDDASKAGALTETNGG